MERSLGAVKVSDLNENMVSTLVVVAQHDLHKASSSAFETDLMYSDSALHSSHKYWYIGM